MYIFDPSQLQEFGYSFYEGEGFTYRYQTSKKLFFTSIYIPFGPNCESEKGFDNFLEHINSLKFTKVKIDLPAIYNAKHASNVKSKLHAAGFKNSKYVQDEETIIITKDDLQPSKSSAKQVRYGLKRASVVIKDKPSQQEIDDMYAIYLTALKRLGATPKDKAVFKKISESCLASMAYADDTQKMEGFLLNYLVDTDLSDIAGKGADKLLIAMFTGLTDKGRELRLGHAIHYQVFEAAFNDYGIDVIDFHGASRAKGRTYVSFKESFSKHFVSFPGSFERTKFF